MQQEANFIEFAFKYRALECEGLSVLVGFLLSELERPVIIVSGRTVGPTGDVYRKVGHQFLLSEQGIIDPSLWVEPSMLSGRNIASNDPAWDTEIELFLAEVGYLADLDKFRIKKEQLKQQEAELNNRLTVSQEELKVTQAQRTRLERGYLGQQSRYQRLLDHHQSRVDSLSLSELSTEGLRELLGQCQVWSADIANTTKGKNQEERRLQLMAQSRFLLGTIAKVANEVKSRQDLDSQTRRQLLEAIVEAEITVFNNIKAYSQNLVQVGWDRIEPFSPDASPPKDSRGEPGYWLTNFRMEKDSQDRTILVNLSTGEKIQLPEGEELEKYYPGVLVTRRQDPDRTWSSEYVLREVLAGGTTREIATLDSDPRVHVTVDGRWLAYSYSEDKFYGPLAKEAGLENRVFYGGARILVRADGSWIAAILNRDQEIVDFVGTLAGKPEFSYSVEPGYKLSGFVQDSAGNYQLEVYRNQDFHNTRRMIDPKKKKKKKEFSISSIISFPAVAVEAVADGFSDFLEDIDRDIDHIRRDIRSLEENLKTPGAELGSLVHTISGLTRNNVEIEYFAGVCKFKGEVADKKGLSARAFRVSEIRDGIILANGDWLLILDKGPQASSEEAESEPERKFQIVGSLAAGFDQEITGYRIYISNNKTSLRIGVDRKTGPNSHTVGAGNYWINKRGQDFLSNLALDYRIADQDRSEDLKKRLELNPQALIETFDSHRHSESTQEAALDSLTQFLDRVLDWEDFDQIEHYEAARAIEIIRQDLEGDKVCLGLDVRGLNRLMEFLRTVSREDWALEVFRGLADPSGKAEQQAQADLAKAQSVADNLTVEEWTDLAVDEFTILRNEHGISQAQDPHLHPLHHPLNTQEEADQVNKITMANVSGPRFEYMQRAEEVSRLLQDLGVRKRISESDYVEGSKHLLPRPDFRDYNEGLQYVLTIIRQASPFPNHPFDVEFGRNAREGFAYRTLGLLRDNWHKLKVRYDTLPWGRSWQQEKLDSQEWEATNEQLTEILEHYNFQDRNPISPWWLLFREGIRDGLVLLTGVFGVGLSLTFLSDRLRRRDATLNRSALSALQELWQTHRGLFFRNSSINPQLAIELLEEVRSQHLRRSTPSPYFQDRVRDFCSKLNPVQRLVFDIMRSVAIEVPRRRGLVSRLSLVYGGRNYSQRQAMNRELLSLGLSVSDRATPGEVMSKHQQLEESLAKYGVAIEEKGDIDENLEFTEVSQRIRQTMPDPSLLGRRTRVKTLDRADGAKQRRTGDGEELAGLAKADSSTDPRRINWKATARQDSMADRIENQMHRSATRPLSVVIDMSTVFDPNLIDSWAEDAAKTFAEIFRKQEFLLKKILFIMPDGSVLPVDGRVLLRSKHERLKAFLGVLGQHFEQARSLIKSGKVPKGKRYSLKFYDQHENARYGLITEDVFSAEGVMTGNIAQLLPTLHIHNHNVLAVGIADQFKVSVARTFAAQQVIAFGWDAYEFVPLAQTVKSTVSSKETAKVSSSTASEPFEPESAQGQGEGNQGASSSAVASPEQILKKLKVGREDQLISIGPGSPDSQFGSIWEKAFIERGAKVKVYQPDTKINQAWQQYSNSNSNRIEVIPPDKARFRSNGSNNGKSRFVAAMSIFSDPTFFRHSHYDPKRNENVYALTSKGEDLISAVSKELDEGEYFIYGRYSYPEVMGAFVGDTELWRAQEGLRVLGDKLAERGLTLTKKHEGRDGDTPNESHDWEVYQVASSSAGASNEKITADLLKVIKGYRRIGVSFMERSGMEITGIERFLKELYVRWFKKKFDRDLEALAKSIATGAYNPESIIRAFSDLIHSERINIYYPDSYSDSLFAILEVLCQRSDSGPILGPELIEVINNPSEYSFDPQASSGKDIWVVVLEALTHLRIKDTVPAVLGSLDSLEGHRLTQAMDSLAKLQAPEAVEPLIAIIEAREEATSYKILKKAVNSLGLLRDSRAVSPLIDLLNSLGDTQINVVRRFEIARSILFALYHIGDNQAMDFLREANFSSEVFYPYLVLSLQRLQGMLLGGEGGFFSREYKDSGWLFGFDPAIDVLVAKINWLPFVRRTVVSCSGHSTDSSGKLSQSNIRIAYNISDRLFLPEARQFHQDFSNLGFESHTPVPSQHYLEGFYSKEAETVNELQTGWNKLEAAVDKQLSLHSFGEFEVSEEVASSGVGDSSDTTISSEITFPELPRGLRLAQRLKWLGSLPVFNWVIVGIIARWQISHIFKQKNKLARSLEEQKDKATLLRGMYIKPADLKVILSEGIEIKNHPETEVHRTDIAHLAVSYAFMPRGMNPSYFEQFERFPDLIQGFPVVFEFDTQSSLEIIPPQNLRAVFIYDWIRKEFIKHPIQVSASASKNTSSMSSDQKFIPSSESDQSASSGSGQPEQLPSEKELKILRILRRGIMAIFMIGKIGKMGWGKYPLYTLKDFPKVIPEELFESGKKGVKDLPKKVENVDPAIRRIISKMWAMGIDTSFCCSGGHHGGTYPYDNSNLGKVLFDMMKDLQLEFTIQEDQQELIKDLRKIRFRRFPRRFCYANIFSAPGLGKWNLELGITGFGQNIEEVQIFWAMVENVLDKYAVKQKSTSIDKPESESDQSASSAVPNQLREDIRKFNKVNPVAFNLLDGLWTFEGAAHQILVQDTLSADRQLAIKQVIKHIPTEKQKDRKFISQVEAALRAVLEFADQWQTDASARSFVENVADYHVAVELLGIKRSSYTLPQPSFSGGLVLDLASGLNFAYYLSNLDINTSYVAVDSSYFVVRCLNRAAEQLKINNLKVIHQDLRRLKRPEGRLAVVHYKNRYIPGLREKMEEIASWINQGGQIVLRSEPRDGKPRNINKTIGDIAVRLIDQGWTFSYKPAESATGHTFDTATFTKASDTTYRVQMRQEWENALAQIYGYDPEKTVAKASRQEVSNRIEAVLDPQGENIAPAGINKIKQSLGVGAKPLVEITRDDLHNIAEELIKSDQAASSTTSYPQHPEIISSDQSRKIEYEPGKPIRIALFLAAGIRNHPEILSDSHIEERIVNEAVETLEIAQFVDLPASLKSDPVVKANPGEFFIFGHWSNKIQVLPDGELVSVGRSPRSYYRINHPLISSNHLAIRRKGSRVILLDGTSENKSAVLPSASSSSSSQSTSASAKSLADSHQAVRRDVDSTKGNQAPGGIDLNPANLDLEVRGGSIDLPQFKIPFDLQTFEGFTFRILKIEPIKDLNKQLSRR